MKGKPKGKEAPKKGQAEEKAEEKAEPSEGDDAPTMVEIVHMGAVKGTAIKFVSMTGQMFMSERERAIAAWAYACGMAKTIKTTERALGTFGASTVFGAVAEDVPVAKGDDGGKVCACCHEPWTAGEEFDKLEKVLILTGGKQAKGKFDPMYM